MMHLGARSAPTAETLTRHLLRMLPLPWTSPPFPGGKGAGGKGRGAAASLGAPSGSSPCAEYVRGRTIRARSPACLSLRGVLTLARAPCATVKKAGSYHPRAYPKGGRRKAHYAIGRRRREHARDAPSARGGPCGRGACCIIDLLRYARGFPPHGGRGGGVLRATTRASIRSRPESRTSTLATVEGREPRRDLDAGRVRQRERGYSSSSGTGCVTPYAEGAQRKQRYSSSSSSSESGEMWARAARSTRRAIVHCPQVVGAPRNRRGSPVLSRSPARWRL